MINLCRGRLACLCGSLIIIFVYQDGDDFPMIKMNGLTKNSLPLKKIQKPCSEIFIISCFKVLLPLDGCRGFAGDVVNDAVYAADFVCYAIGNVAKDFVRDF